MSPRPFEKWLFGKWGPLEKALAAWGRDVIWPENVFCCACGRATDGGALCAACRDSLRYNGAFCAWREKELQPGLTAWSLRPHDGVPRQLIIRLKYGAEARAAGALADLLLPLPSHIFFPPDTVVTWVPMPRSRRIERCIDHGQVLAEAAAERLGLSCRPLLRRTDTKEKPQATLNREQREKNLSGAFSPAEKITFPVLLVDDVLTTGTTARRCAEALRRGGAEEITVLAFTRAMHGVPDA